MLTMGVVALLTSLADSVVFRPEDIDRLPEAPTVVDLRRGILTIELPAIEVPAQGMAGTPVYRVSVPVAVAAYGFDVAVLDEGGGALPRDRLHHVVLTDASRRELFLPLALPIFGGSKESPRIRFPKRLVGVPLPAGDRYIIAAMFDNPESGRQRVRVRMVIRFVREGKTFPLLRGYPMTLDVTYPLGREGGRHDFAVPPGRSTRSWEGSPQIQGWIVALGGHVHDYATLLQLLDVTTGDTIARVVPRSDSAGHVRSVPILPLYRWHRLGIRLDPSHVYRVTVVYDNPTGRVSPSGGMGSVIGLFVPRADVAWPALDAEDPIYRANVTNLLRNVGRHPMTAAAHGHH